jgi:hypothetical protein
MTSYTDSPAFWVAVAALLYPALFATMLVLVIMPPLNMIAVPAWFLVCAGAVGNVSNGYANAKRRRAAQREARRYAPGVVPIQRTNAL